MFRDEMSTPEKKSQGSRTIQFMQYKDFAPSVQKLMSKGGKYQKAAESALSAFGKARRIQIRSATPLDSMNEGGMLRAVDQQLPVHSQR